MIGDSTAFATAVEKRSCSKISGRMSLEVDTLTPGSSSSRISFMRRSFAGLAYELTKQTATASTPLRRSTPATARASSSSSGSSTAPAKSTRSVTSSRSLRRTYGGATSL
jgi:hypothetical protein